MGHPPLFPWLGTATVLDMFARPAFLLLLLISTLPALEVGRPFGTHMVLPMARDLPVWGTAAAGAEVELGFRGNHLHTTADSMGNWRLILPAMRPSAEPASMVIRSGEHRLELGDILIGRVFLCSGQSNMDFPLNRATGGSQEVKTAGKLKAIRLLNLTGAPTDRRRYNQQELERLHPQKHFTGRWQPATETSAATFSAIAWWMGRILHEHDGVPVGLVENAVGGSGTEAWIPIETLRKNPEYRGLLDPTWVDNPKISAWARGRAKQNLGPHLQAAHPFKPGFLFDSGVRHFTRFPFEAVIWYQGETNAEINDRRWNARLIADLVAGWREQLDSNDLPFYLVQLPRIGGDDPLRKYWPEYRKAQSDAAESLDNTRLIVTEDLGWTSPDVHPPDKLPVARRLAAEILRHQDR